jgi:hypothetical protein
LADRTNLSPKAQQPIQDDDSNQEVGQLGLVDRVVYEPRGDSLTLPQAATLDVLDPGERAGVRNHLSCHLFHPA